MDERQKDEEKRLRRLRLVIDLSLAVLMQQTDLTLRDAFNVLENAKKAALALFPDKGEVFDLIYAPRLKRVIRERFVIPGGTT